MNFLPPESEKNLLAFIIIAASFGIFLVFFQNQEFLAEGEAVPEFTLLAASGMSLMILLFFLVSQRATRHARKLTSKKRHK